MDEGGALGWIETGWKGWKNIGALEGKSTTKSRVLRTGRLNIYEDRREAPEACHVGAESISGRYD
jgi:hypothetical protein